MSSISYYETLPAGGPGDALFTAQELNLLPFQFPGKLFETNSANDVSCYYDQVYPASGAHCAPRFEPVLFYDQPAYSTVMHESPVYQPTVNTPEPAQLGLFLILAVCCLVGCKVFRKER